jgi:phosphate starvation-inducible membrane PsiE
MRHNRSYGSGHLSHPMRQSLIVMAMVLLAVLAFATTAYAHAVTKGDKGYIQEISGMKLIPFMYLGAKHMVTGYDHLLFLFGVVFFLWLCCTNPVRDSCRGSSVVAVMHEQTAPANLQDQKLAIL